MIGKVEFIRLYRKCPFDARTYGDLFEVHPGVMRLKFNFKPNQFFGFKLFN